MRDMTGAELRTRRERADLRQWQLAIEMRVASSRISQIESLARVPDVAADRYLAALRAAQDRAMSPKDAA